MNQLLAILGTSILFGLFGLYAVLRRGCPGHDRCAASDCHACGWAGKDQ